MDSLYQPQPLLNQSCNSSIQRTHIALSPTHIQLSQDEQFIMTNCSEDSQIKRSIIPESGIHKMIVERKVNML